MPTKFTNYIFLAEPFGFGPISSSISIARQIKKLAPLVRCLFIGRGTSHQLAAKSNVFDELIFSDDLTEQSFSLFGGAISPENCLVIANTYPMGAAAAKRANFPCIYVDTLFWMWNELPINLLDVEKYYIEEFHCIEINMDRFGCSDKFKKVPPLIDIDVRPLPVSHPFILVSLGGIDSSLYDFPVFYEKLIEHLSTAEKFWEYEILICGGGRRFLNEEFKNFETPRLKIKCLDPQEYMANLRAADIVFSSAGLHGFYESYFLKKKTLFLPPQSYSQYMQLKFIMKTLPGVVGANFEQLGILHSLREKMPDAERISEVKRTNKALVEDHCINIFFDMLEQFCYGQICTDWSSEDKNLATEELGPEVLAKDLMSICITS